MKQWQQLLPGLGLALAIAVPAWYLGKVIPVVGSPVFGILLGMLLAFWRRSYIFQEGIQFTSKKMLQYAIIFLGFDMNLFNIMYIGRQTIILMLFTLTAAFLTAFFVGKALKIDSNTKTLIGVGTAICGGSAIAATAPIIQATDEEVAHSVSTIFLFNVMAAFLFPFLGHAMGMDDSTFGMWAGTAVNDTSSVVAAGYSFSNTAGDLAVIVKLTRTLMIIPVTLILALYTAQKNATRSNYDMKRVFPWFILVFLGACILSTYLPISAAACKTLSKIGKFIIVMAMAAIGLNTNLIQLVKKGGKPLLLGFACWCVLSTTSLIVQNVMT